MDKLQRFFEDNRATSGTWSELEFSRAFPNLTNDEEDEIRETLSICSTDSLKDVILRTLNFYHSLDLAESNFLELYGDLGDSYSDETEFSEDESPNVYDSGTVVLYNNRETVTRSGLKEQADPKNPFEERNPEEWELNIIALERGEWVEGMSSAAFSRWRRERPALPDSVSFYNRPKLTQEATEEKETPLPNTQHNFAKHHFNKPTWCHYCTKFIWQYLPNLQNC